MHNVLASLVLSSLCLILSTAAFSEDAQQRKIHARIGIRGSVELKPVENCGHPGWERGTESYRKSIYAQSSPLFSNEWSDFSISFIPEEDGTLELWLMGMDAGFDPETKTRRPVWVYFDNLSASGAGIKNPDFEELDGNGNLKDWQYGPPLSDKHFASSGSNFVAVWHDRGCGQRGIAIEKNRKITLTFKVRGTIE